MKASTDTARVFLIEQNLKYDISDLSGFGQVVFLCEERTANPMNTEYFPELVRKRMSQHGYDPSRDFLCMTGQVLKIALFLAIMARDYGKVRLLVYDAQASGYRERVLDVS